MQRGGPPIYASARGPKGLARAARWADGNYGGSLGLDPGPLLRNRDAVRAAWNDAGRADPPYLINAVWFALGLDAEALMMSAGERYFRSPPGFVFTLDIAPCYTEGRVRAVLDNFEAAGWDEVMFTPVSTDLRQLDALEKILAQR